LTLPILARQSAVASRPKCHHDKKKDKRKLTEAAKPIMVQRNRQTREQPMNKSQPGRIRNFLKAAVEFICLTALFAGLLVMAAMLPMFCS
jgi:hypothetical protein